MSIKTRWATVRELAIEIVACNPGARNVEVTVETLMRRVEVDPEDASHVMGDLDWGGKGIAVLPECTGDLTVDGNLIFYANQLESLPESFGSLTVGRVLHLSNNPVAASLNKNSFPRLPGPRLAL